MLQDLAAIGVDLVGLDPSMTLTYRSEYAGALEKGRLPSVLLVQEWLARHLDALPSLDTGAEYLLLPHCTERATAPAAVREWQTVFARCGLALKILPSGCCGMAGTWGHEAEHRTTSEHIYALSWARHVAKAGKTGRLLADGYSCRSQVKLIDGVKLNHPVQALLAALQANPKARSRPDQAKVYAA
jgi:(R)-2-hydroxyglutarate dehydrogenase